MRDRLVVEVGSGPHVMVLSAPGWLGRRGDNGRGELWTRASREASRDTHTLGAKLGRSWTPTEWAKLGEAGHPQSCVERDRLFARSVRLNAVQRNESFTKTAAGLRRLGGEAHGFGKAREWMKLRCVSPIAVPLAVKSLCDGFFVAESP